GAPAPSWMSSSRRNRASTCARRGSTTCSRCVRCWTIGSRSRTTAGRPRRSAASRSRWNELDPHSLDLRRCAFRVRDHHTFAVTERRAVERGAEPFRERDRGQLDDPAMRDREDTVLLTDAHRDTRPRRKLLGREFARVLALAQDLGPVRERAHLAEDSIADNAAHLREKARLDSIQPPGNKLCALFRARQRARQDEGKRGCALRERFRHRATGRGERALLVPALAALRMTPDLEERHGAEPSLCARTAW